MAQSRRNRTLDNLPRWSDGPVVYWMQRDMRIWDNWALLHAADTARKLHVPLTACFALPPSFLGATLRAYDFLLQGLQEVERDLRRLNIPFLLLEGNPPDEICRLAGRLHPALLVTDFNSLRLVTAWKTGVATCVDVQMTETDAHNVVPAWVASDHQEWSAATLRRKLGRLLQTWLVDIPTLHAFPGTLLPPPVDWSPVAAVLRRDRATHPLVRTGNACRHAQAHVLLRRGPARLRQSSQRPDSTGNVHAVTLAALRPGQRTARRPRSTALGRTG